MAAYYNEIEPYAAEWLRNLIKAGHIADGEVDTRSVVDVAPDDLRGFTQCHFFAGIGGWSLAARLAGWPDDRPLWTGSAPCQPFSVAGKGAGQADERHLWPEYFRLIRAIRPPVVMGEQVAAAVGKSWLDGVCADLEGIGYACGAAVVPACAVNAPHRRDRLWFVADAQKFGREKWERKNRQQNAGSCQQSRVDTAGIDKGHVADAHDTERRQDGARRYVNDGAQTGWDEDAGDVGACGASDVADAMCIGRQGQGQVGEPGNPEACGNGEASHALHAGARFWDGAGYIVGADQKARRFEPSIRLLAHGVPARVGKLRAYGNAIVPQVAAEVIAAFLEAQEPA